MAGDFNPLTLQQIEKYINDVTPRNPFGRRISQRVPQKVERGVYGRESTSAIDLLFSRICESAVSAPRRFSEEGRREIEERKKEALKGWAIATGNWHTDLSEFTNDKEPFAQGTDSKVYTSKYGGYVIKASKGKPYGKRFRADIDNVALFNHIFPNSKYDIVGYGEIDGNFVRILRQPFVDFSQSDILTEEERVAYMAELGFKPLNKENTAFSNGDFVVADLQKANIVRDVTGNIRVIDADVKLHTTDIGGNYSYTPVEEDVLDDDVLYRSSEDDISEDDDIRFRVSQTELEAVNERFNNALDSFSKDNADRVIFDLGRPSEILKAAGVTDKVMRLYGSKVASKMKKHGFAAQELRDLPKAIANPIAVFNNYNEVGNRSILTELHTMQGNFLVSLSVGKGQDIDFNIVSSVFGKGDVNIINWLNNDYATYINKEKALNYLHLATPFVAASNNQELVSAIKVVESFENPQITEEENSGEQQNLTSDEINRSGEGAVSDEGVTMASDPVSKAIGEPRYGRGKKMREYAERLKMMFKSVQTIKKVNRLISNEINLFTLSLYVEY